VPFSDKPSSYSTTDAWDFPKAHALPFHLHSTHAHARSRLDLRTITVQLICRSTPALLYRASSCPWRVDSHFPNRLGSQLTSSPRCRSRIFTPATTMMFWILDYLLAKYHSFYALRRTPLVTWLHSVCTNLCQLTRIDKGP
jgi:hypothetical protein